MVGLPFVVEVVVAVEEDEVALLLLGLPLAEEVVGDEDEDEEEVVGLPLPLLLPFDFVLVLMLVLELEVVWVGELVVEVVDFDALPGLPALPVEELDMVLEDDVDLDMLLDDAVELDEDDTLDDLAGLFPPFDLLVELLVAVDDTDVVLELVKAEVEVEVEVEAEAEAEVELPFPLLLLLAFSTILDVVLTLKAVELVVAGATITGLPSFLTNFAPQMPALATGAPMSALR